MLVWRELSFPPTTIRIPDTIEREKMIQFIDNLEPILHPAHGGLSRPRGRFPFTAPIEIGTCKDTNTGLNCTSLGRDRYKELLVDAGFRVVATHPDKGANNYYDAETVG
jgi:hypothetical protein